MPKNKTLITSSINRIREKLIRNHEATQNEVGKIAIQEILAVSTQTHSNGRKTAGEYNLPEDDIIDVKNKITRKNESETALIERIVSQIRALANTAKKIHLQHNFTAPHSFTSKSDSLRLAENHSRYNRVLNHTLAVLTKLTGKEIEELDEIAVDNLVSLLSDANDYPHPEDPVDILKMLNKLENDGIIAAIKPNCLNNITCISTNEFFFYPNEVRDPISEDSFNEITSKVEELASTLPPNLHLFLSSFAVSNSNQHVNNLTLYVMCGETPSINVSAKMISDNNDPIYASYQNPYFKIGENYRSRIDDMTMQLVSMKKSLKETPLNLYYINEILKNFIDSMQLPIFSHHPKEPKNILGQYNQLEMEKNKLLPYLIMVSKNIDVNGITDRTTLKLLYTDMLAYLEIFNKLDFMMVSHNKEQIHRAIPFIIPYPNSEESATIKKSNLNFSGHIICKTEKGQSFSRFTEICVDHLYNGAFHALLQQPNQMPTEFVSTYASQVISSNSVDLKPKSLICATPTHVDNHNPCFSTDQHSLIKMQATFGDEIMIKILPQKNLEKLTPKLLKIISESNYFAIHLHAHFLYLAQHPNEIKVIHQLLNRLVYNNLLTILKKMATPNYVTGCLDVVRFLITIIIDDLNRELSEFSHSKCISILNDKIQRIDNHFVYGKPHRLLAELRKHCKLFEEFTSQLQADKESKQFFKKLQSIRSSSLWLPKPNTLPLLMDKPASSFMRSHK